MDGFLFVKRYRRRLLGAEFQLSWIPLCLEGSGGRNRGDEVRSGEPRELWVRIFSFIKFGFRGVHESIRHSGRKALIR